MCAKMPLMPFSPYPSTKKRKIRKITNFDISEVAGRLTNTLGAWPAIPPSLTDALNDALGALKVDKYPMLNCDIKEYVIVENRQIYQRFAKLSCSGFYSDREQR